MIRVLFAGDGEPGDGAAAAVSGERNAASPQSQEDGEEEGLVCCEYSQCPCLIYSFANWHTKSVLKSM